MRDILQDLTASLRRGDPVCYTSLVETRGSTPQKAGASMLVFPDGSQTGTLGGGCVEAEVKRRALQLLDAGQPQLLTFQLDSDYGWDDGLICGGRMKMLVDPLRTLADAAYFENYEQTVQAGTGCTEAVVIDAEKVHGAADGDRYLFDSQGELVAHRGNREAPAQVLQNLRPLADRPRPYIAEGVSYLPHLRRCRLVIVGAGHVGRKVAELAADVDFDVWVVDDREEYCSAARIPAAKRLIVGPIDTSLSGLDVDGDTMCIIVTRGHNHDEEALYHLAETPARYVGMIGSKRKIKLIFEDLIRDGISRDALARVHAPLGFDIGSQTVPEIAVSIVAELIAVRNRGAVPTAPRGDSLVHELAQPKPQV